MSSRKSLQKDNLMEDKEYYELEDVVNERYKLFRGKNSSFYQTGYLNS
jgi:hypothetical protein